MSYRIRPGDTLSGIAARNGTTVSALMRANPQIKNANLIYAGHSLSIPGRTDGFEHSRPRTPSRPSGHVPSTGGTTAPAGQGGNAAFQLASQYLGWNARDLKVSSNPVGRAMQDWVPNNVNCANFVSGVLIATGQIKQSQGSASVMQLMGNLDRDPKFQRVSLQDARPGDVVSMKTNGGQHVVLFAGWKNGRPQFIGSNNVNPDGSQRVSFTQMNYPIMAIHRYRG